MTTPRTTLESSPPYPPPPPTPPKKGINFGSLVVGLVLIGLLFGASMALVRWFGRDDIDRAQIGDCLRFTEGVDQPYRVMDCPDPSAGFTLLATKPAARECIDVPGVSRTWSYKGRSYCIGEKGVDVSKAINGIKAGECVIFDGENPSKAACRKGSVPVLLVLEDVDKAADSSLCVERGAEDVRQTYAYGIYAPVIVAPDTWDRVLCLGPPKK
jgi:hypothetical protein